MSHRVTFSSEMKDRDLVIQALTATNTKYQDAGNDRLLITSGALARATINLKNGVVESDTDIHRKDELGALSQAYSEAEFRRNAARKGATIENRAVIEHNGIKGVVKLSCYASTMTG